MRCGHKRVSREQRRVQMYGRLNLYTELELELGLELKLPSFVRLFVRWFVRSFARSSYLFFFLLTRRAWPASPRGRPRERRTGRRARPARRSAVARACPGT